MIRQEANGIPYYSFGALANHGEIINAVFTRLGGVSRPPFSALNVGHLVGDEPAAVEANHHLVRETLGLSRREVVTAHQVHGNSVAFVGMEDAGSVIPTTDALITRTPGVTLMLRFADCLPIVLWDPVQHAIGLAHAGWRGTAAGAAQRTASMMVEGLGSDPTQIIAGLGPAIGPCCYQIGAEVANPLKASLQNWERAIKVIEGSTYCLDLWEANRQQLVEAGIRKIEISHVCTSCHSDEFFSHRAERGRTGRFAAVAGIKRSS